MLVQIRTLAFFVKHTVMLASRSNTRVLGVESSLETGNELPHVLGSTERVFARCFLTSSPARVTERVYVGRPEVEPSVGA